MSAQSIDHAALAPAYAVAAGAVLMLLADLFLGVSQRRLLPAVAAVGPLGGAVAALVVGTGRRATFCTPGGTLPGGVEVGPSCSYVTDAASVLLTVAFCVLTLVVLGLSADVLRSGVVPAGEYGFLLLCSLTGAVVLSSARDLLTLIVALETLTLPVYVLVGLRRTAAVPERARAQVAAGPGRGDVASGGARTDASAADPASGGERTDAGPPADPASGGERTDAGPPADPADRVASAEAAVTFFVVSVVSTAVTLLGVGLLYGLTGAVHLDRLAAALDARADVRALPLVAAAAVLILVGLLFKLAAVPFHVWAPATYDGAPLPVAAYLATASKLGGVAAVLVVTVVALRPVLPVVGPVLAVVAALTMTVGNLVALRQRRLVRLLAWSSVAQAGYLLAPLGVFATAAGRDAASVRAAVAGTVAFTLLYLVVNIGTFGAVVALRRTADGGSVDDLRGAARRAPWATALFVLGLAGLAGLPPGLAGLFAKVTVVRAVLDGSAGWLAVVVAVNAVIGLAYYVRAAAVCFAAEPGTSRPAAPADAAAPADPAGPGDAGQTMVTSSRVTALVVTGTASVVALGVVAVGFWPQWTLDAARAAADSLL